MESAKKPAGAELKLRLLGPLAVWRDGRPITPPASRKARALLAYLVMAPRATARSRLCELLWDSVSDSRAELRWCLSKLRGAVGATRLHCDEDAVRIELANSIVDALEVQRLARKGIDALTAEQARALLENFHGDFLEGLELDGCPVFSGWLLAQRRRFRVWRIALLQRVVESDPQAESSGVIEKWLEFAPFDVRAHEHLLHGLVRRGRHREAQEHLDASIRLFCAEDLDSAPLAKAWRTATGQRAQTTAPGAAERDGAQAYDYFLQGRQQLSRMMQRGLAESRRMFEHALELDPGYGPAWAGLATVHTCLAEWFDSGTAGFARAEHASRRALETAPQLAEAHVARGLAHSLSNQYEESRREFATAIRLNPYLFEAYYYSARTAFSCGDMARAARLFQEATQLRQEDFQSPMLLGNALRALGRDDDAREAVRTGIRRAAQILALCPHDGRALSLGAGALIDDGQVERGLAWSKRALELYPDDTSALINVACVHARLDQRGTALDLLERAFARGCGKRDWVENDPDYANLRQELRFHRLLGGLR
jgi:DNA-binding SARP family transcriptional activator/Tfp pilus assembly protein PilF